MVMLQIKKSGGFVLKNMNGKKPLAIEHIWNVNVRIVLGKEFQT